MRDEAIDLMAAGGDSSLDANLTRALLYTGSLIDEPQAYMADYNEKYATPLIKNTLDRGKNSAVYQGLKQLGTSLAPMFEEITRNVNDFIAGGAVAANKSFYSGRIQRYNEFEKVFQPYSTAFNLGKSVVDAGSLVAGVGTSIGGGFGAIGGIALSSTGSGAIVGGGIFLAGTGIAVYGGTVAINGAQGLVSDAINLMSGKGRSNKEEESETEQLPDIKYPGNDPSKSPGKDWQWKGKGKQGSSQGNYTNPNTGEYLYPDLGHSTEGKGIVPHWDYKSPDGKWYRIFPDGKMQPK